MHQLTLRLVTLCWLAAFVFGCSNTSIATPPGNLVTEDDRAWCSNHPEAHAEAASILNISFVGDYIRSSGKATGPKIKDLEPPYLAIPPDDNEPLTYQVQFENQADSDKACRAALDELD
ncbi:MAG TPA: hypothetical protein DCL16_09700 [Acidimicrobiaceae bacterium]|nr:hypothetical protein [Acidimicrobiaceae bacterium]